MSKCIRTTKNDVHWGQTAVTTVITIGDCKPARTMREGCGSTESGVCSFVLYLPSKRKCPPPPGIHLSHTLSTTLPSYAHIPLRLKAAPRGEYLTAYRSLALDPVLLSLSLSLTGRLSAITVYIYITARRRQA